MLVYFCKQMNFHIYIYIVQHMHNHFTVCKDIWRNSQVTTKKVLPAICACTVKFSFWPFQGHNWTMDFDSDQAAASLHVTFRLCHQCVELKTDQNTKPNYLSTPQETHPYWFLLFGKGGGLGSWVVDRRHCFFMDNKVTKQEPYWRGLILWISLSQARERGSDAC